MNRMENGQNNHDSEGDDVNYIRERRTNIDAQNIINGDINSKDDLKIYSQKQLEDILNQREDLILEQYDHIVMALKDQLSQLQDHLQNEDQQNLINQEQVIDFVKEAHTCPFNCFKGQLIKSVDNTPIFKSLNTPSNLKDLQDIQNRNRNLSTGTINFVKDKQLKANLILQKKLENAEKEIGKSKQTHQAKYDSLQLKYDALQIQYNQQLENDKQAFEKEEEKSGQIEELSIKLLELEEENKSMQQKFNKIKDLTKEQFNLEISEEEDEDEQSFSDFMKNLEAIILRNKNEFFKIEDEFEQFKQQAQMIQKQLKQKESEQDALIQKIASAEIEVNEHKQQINNLNDKIQLETQIRKEIEINYKKDLQQIFITLEDEQKETNSDKEELKEKIIFKIRKLLQDQKSQEHAQNNKEYDEKNEKIQISQHKIESQTNEIEKQKMEQLQTQISHLQKENEELQQKLQNTQNDLDLALEYQKQMNNSEQQYSTIEEQKDAESMDSNSIQLKKKENNIKNICSIQPLSTMQQEQVEMNVQIDDSHKQIFELDNIKQLKAEFKLLYKKLRDEKIYAEQTAIDTKIQLAEMSMNKDYFEHNFIKLLKKVK